ncbi:olfactory receptor 281 (predicted) [Rattus norvegicus]|uniref:Olfactory receptor n=1 Tax=Rattus norvegicus TaxID=10116 RepID=A6I7U3_RAT|nr:olfactory receptor 281 (predicted) [Rattus norvegicus]
MRRQNHSSTVDFILLGFSNYPELQRQMFGPFLVIYLVTVLGNAIIITIIFLDQSLHIPMYLFLQNLSLVDLCFSTVITPKMLMVLTTENTTISFGGCFAQMYFILLFGVTECFLLGAMAYDRFAAICHPLSYPVIMNKRVFVKLVMFSWFSGTMMTTLQSIWVFSFPYCGHREINHLFCETPPVLELACADTFVFEIYAFTGTIFIVVVPFLLILLSYTRILFDAIHYREAEGLFHMCLSSHLCHPLLWHRQYNLSAAQIQVLTRHQENDVIGIHTAHPSAESTYLQPEK